MGGFMKSIRFRVGAADGVGSWTQYVFYPHPNNAGGGASDAVMLPLPSEISDSLNAQWETEEDAIKRDLSQLRDLGIMDKSGDKSPWWKKAWRGLKNQAVEKLAPEGHARGLRKQSGQALNTHEEHYFKSMEFKTWEFTHKVYPNNPSEAAAIQTIIDNFKRSASPGLNPAGRYFLYPDTVDISFHGTSGVPKPRRSIIEKVDINYTPNEGYQALEDGSPVGYEIALGFKEVTMPMRS